MTTPRRVLGFLFVLAVTLVSGAGAASADVPSGDAWPAAEGRSTLDTLLLFGGGTIGLFVVIVLFGLLTARNNYVPPPPGTDVVPVGDHAPAHH